MGKEMLAINCSNKKMNFNVKNKFSYTSKNWFCNNNLKLNEIVK